MGKKQGKSFCFWIIKNIWRKSRTYFDEFFQKQNKKNRHDILIDVQQHVTLLMDVTILWQTLYFINNNLAGECE